MSEHGPTNVIFDPGPTGPPRAARWSPSVLCRTLRRHAFYWTTALALAAATGLIVNAATARARARALEDAFGARVAVIVTTSGIAGGTPLLGATETLDFPESLVPDEAVTELEVGQLAAHPLTAGSVLTSADVLQSGSIAMTKAAIAVPIGPTTPPVQRGLTVLLVVNADPFSGFEAQIIDGIVTNTTDQQVVVAISRDDLPTASAALSGNATLAVSAG